MAAPLTPPNTNSDHRSVENTPANNSNGDDNGDHRSVWTAERLFRASYKDLGSPGEVTERFYRHLLQSETCRHSLLVLLQESSATTRDYSITVDAFDLLQADPVLGQLLLRYPSTLLPCLEEAVVHAQRTLKRTLQEEAVVEMDGSGLETRSRTKVASSSMMVVKGDKGGADGSESVVATTRVHARLVHLPPTCCKPSLANLVATDVGKILQVSGTVVRVGSVQMYESARTYQCAGPKGCGRSFVVHADLEQRHNALRQPERCVHFLKPGQRCGGTKFQPVDDSKKTKGGGGGSVHTDYQEIKIQEAASSAAAVGHIPRSLLIKLQHDLVDHCQPGDEVVVVGSLLAQWHQPSYQPDVECHVDMALSAHSVRVICEKGSSAWKKGSGDVVGELDKFRKEFDAYWRDPKHQENPIRARDFICKAVCPKLYGLQVIKLALLMTLVGGVSSDAYEGIGEGDNQRPLRDKNNQLDRGHHENNDDDDDDAPDQFQIIGSNGGDGNDGGDATAYYGGDASSSLENREKRRRKQQRSKGGNQQQVKTRRRDQSHLLLVGDPGTGKSQFLRFAAALCPRSVLTTGVGTTSAGLTCAAVREGNGKEFALEAGALVLADKGVCCIDEFGCIQAQDRTTIHEAMEQQTLSVAKAGIVCKLNCRATIIAVMNPRDCLYDNHASLSANTGLGTPLLSRFDLIFKLVDTSDAERDSNVTTYLLNRAIRGTGLDVSENTSDDISCEVPWSMEKLRAYISIVKERFQPVMSNEAALLLERHYEKCRSSQSNTIPVTVRFLESLIRLSQAHARLMYHEAVTLQDAVAVIRVMECTAFTYGGFDGNVQDFENAMYCDPMTVDFSSDADTEFLCFQYRILSLYGMLNCMNDSHKRKALGALEASTVLGALNDSWTDMEHARDNLQFSCGPQSTIPERPQAPCDRGERGVTQDHYGRYYFSQSATLQNKRVRR